MLLNRKSARHIVFRIEQAEQTTVLCVEASFEVLPATNKPSRYPIFYARWQPGGWEAAKPALNLDLVPTGQVGEVRVYFRGQPLPDVTLTLRTPDEQEKPLKADGEGRVRFESKQTGPHLLTLARHREPVSGFYQGQKYDVTSHNAALTWIQ